MSFLDDLFGPPNVEKLEAKRDVKGLIRALNYMKYVYVRKNAVEALGKIGDNRAVEPLIAALNDSDSDVREYAADALGEIGDKRAVEPLIVALRDSNDNVRNNSVWALGKIGDKRAVEPLIASLKDSDSVRSEAAIALVTIYRKGILDDVHKHLILAHKNKINEKHYDYVEYIKSPCGTEFDSDRHTDKVIGVDFPI